MTIDVWPRHPTQRFLGSDMLASPRRWTGGSMPGTEAPINAAVASLDDAGVELGPLGAGCGPHRQDLVSNDEVTEWVGLRVVPWLPDTPPAGRRCYTIGRLSEEFISFMKTGTGQRKALSDSNYPMITPARALARLETGLTDVARLDFPHHDNSERAFRPEANS